MCFWGEWSREYVGTVLSLSRTADAYPGGVQRLSVVVAPLSG